MALFEALAIDLGSSIGKSILRIWLKNANVTADASSTIIDMLKSWAIDKASQRKAQRQLEDIGEKVAENLLPIFEKDGASLDEGSRTSVALAVAETLNMASSAVLAQFNLEPTELEKYLLTHPQGTAYFNDIENNLYRSIISESCAYIVDIASQLPTFTESTFREILKRENYLLEIAKQTLEEMFRLREQADPMVGVPQFELKYRRAVVSKLDELRLFGVNIPLTSRRHRLSVAYVTLSVKQQSMLDTSANKSTLKMASPVEYEAEIDEEIVSVEAALSESRYLLIRGAAGSGKTTLLQWIAVNSALQSFKEPLMKWNSTIPFYISLRSCSEISLPGPEDFPKFISTAIANTMPKGWVHSKLASGQAIVLVDGLDEVPELRREEVRNWVKDMVQAYPEAYYFITSRPNAIEENWIKDEAFKDAELQPMELSDIHSFIDHWHQAIAEEINDEQEKAELPSCAQRLKEEIENTRSIRNLATNPLLCAMLCTLNRERGEHLPSDRIKLYEVCCEMLIEGRDRDRRISLIDYPAAVLTYREKLVLLQDLAYWMIKNGWTEVESRRVEDRFARKLTYMHNIPENISHIDVRRLFVERANIIREPVVGRIDFAHRTFQEFLAAKAALDEGDIGVLVKNAQDDQWQQVIILASGLATRKVREELIRELIQRGDIETENRYQLHLLAVSCLDTSVELGSDLKAEITKRLNALIPPKNRTDAKALAAAGELVVPYLSVSNLARKKQLSAATSALCIYSLAHIGGDTALKALEGYSKDRRITVLNELSRVNDFFDKKKFEQQIFKNVSGIDLKGYARVSDLDFIVGCTNLVWLNLWNNEKVSDLTPLAGLTQLRSLDLRGCRKVSDLTSLAGLNQLTAIILRGCVKISDLSPLARLIQLEMLDLWNCVKVSDLTPLASLTRLSSLDLTDCIVSDLTPLAGLTQLRSLDLWNCVKVSDLTPLTGLTRLRGLNLGYCRKVSDLTALAGLTQLRSLCLMNCQEVSDLTPLAGLTQLNRLDLSGCRQVSDLTPLAGLTQLRSLDLENCKKVTDLTPLADLTQLHIQHVRK